MLVALVSILVACHSTPQQHSPAQPAPVRKHANALRYDVDPARSTIVLRVYRDGPLARFGHNHVIAVTAIQGRVYREADILQSEVELSFPVAGMIVDSPDDRAKAGTDFPGVLSPAAIAGTREHMLGPQLLAAEQYPRIALRSIGVSGQWPQLQLLIEIQLRNFTSQFPLPVHMSEIGNTLIADGAIKLSQVQLGLQPYSVLGGGLRVNDTIDVQFHILAARATSP